MSEKFKAVVIDNQNETFTREIKEINKKDYYWKYDKIGLREFDLKS